MFESGWSGRSTRERWRSTSNRPVSQLVRGARELGLGSVGEVEEVHGVRGHRTWWFEMECCILSF